MSEPATLVLSLRRGQQLAPPATAIGARRGSISLGGTTSATPADDSPSVAGHEPHAYWVFASDDNEGLKEEREGAGSVLAHPTSDGDCAARR